MITATVDVKGTARAISQYLFASCVHHPYPDGGRILWDDTEYTGTWHPWMLAEIKKLNLKMLRYPSAQPYLWEKGTLSKADETIPDWSSKETCTDTWNTDKFMEFCAEIGADPLITTTTFRPSTSGDYPIDPAELLADADRAVAWVNYCISQGYNVPVWEIGNEDYYRSVSPGTDRCDAYRSVLTAQAPRLKAVLPPTSKLIAQAIAYPADLQAGGRFGDWNEMVDEFTDYIDGLAIHLYYGFGEWPTDDKTYHIPLMNWSPPWRYENFIPPTSDLFDVRVIARTDDDGVDPASYALVIYDQLGNVVDNRTQQVAVGETYTTYMHNDVYMEVPSSGSYKCEMQRYLPASGQGTPYVQQVAISPSGQNDWTVVWGTQVWYWQHKFCNQQYFEDVALPALNVYGKEIYITESGTPGVGLQLFWAGAGLVTARDLILCARQGIKARMQFDCYNYDYQDASWAMICNYTRLHPGEPTKRYNYPLVSEAAYRSAVDAKAQVMQFLSPRIGTTCVDVDITSDTFTTNIGGGASDYAKIYETANYVEVMVSRTKFMFYVWIVNVHHTESAEVTITGLPSSSANGALVETIRADDTTVQSIINFDDCLLNAKDFVAEAPEVTTVTDPFEITVPAASVTVVSYRASTASTASPYRPGKVVTFTRNRR